MFRGNHLIFYFFSNILKAVSTPKRTVRLNANSIHIYHIQYFTLVFYPQFEKWYGLSSYSLCKQEEIRGHTDI